ncbi:Crossover junction endodeoxyribonuclease RuvC [hydrothermal vent metagenome]|uniref:Crossover junction endodeoxyribonuclease RuvC n=1 Tax=hydrothermal vent metagenome TaxID=652676 RepID=A0A3B0RF54_9ZZZZ
MAGETIRIIGIDPGLRNTGWGLITICGSQLTYVADGTIRSNPKDPLAERLMQLHDGLSAVIQEWQPDEAAVEETFVNKDARATLKLGAARGIALLVPARAGLSVGEYAPNMVKKTVVGSGHAGKEQITAMIKILLPKASPDSADSADALAIAICHSQHRKHQSLVDTHS